MERNEIRIKVQDIFRDVMDNGDITIDDAMSSDDIEEWDSLTHVQLIIEIEKAFRIKFTAKEMISWNSIGEMMTCIQNKTR